MKSTLFSKWMVNMVLVRDVKKLLISCLWAAASEYFPCVLLPSSWWCSLPQLHHIQKKPKKKSKMLPTPSGCISVECSRYHLPSIINMSSQYWYPLFLSISFCSLFFFECLSSLALRYRLLCTDISKVIKEYMDDEYFVTMGHKRVESTHPDTCPKGCDLLHRSLSFFFLVNHCPILIY